jgi:ribosome-binding factor A
VTTHRQQRVSELLSEELGLLIGAELTDPRLAEAMVAVTGVEVSADLRNARVYVEHALSPAMSRQVLEALQHAQSYLRRALAENLRLRYVPELSFQIDRTSERARRIDALLDSIASQSSSLLRGSSTFAHDDRDSAD